MARNVLFNIVIVLTLFTGLIFFISGDVRGFTIQDDIDSLMQDEDSTSNAVKAKEEPALPELPPFEIPFDPNLPTKRVLVSSFEVAAAGIPSGMKAEKGLKAQLITALSKSKNFMVIDRDMVSDLRDELVLKKSGAVTSESSVQAGKLMGAQVIIKGVITEFSESVKGKASGTKLSIGKAAEIVGIFEASDVIDALVAADPAFKHGKETVVGVVRLDIRLIDINTGSIIKSIDARGELTRDSTQRALGVAGLTTVSKEFEKTVIGQATRLAIQDAVVKIFEDLKRVPWKGLVAAVKPDGTVIVNAGSSHNINVGQEMVVEAEVNRITDPVTGMLIYTECEKTAEISVFSAKDNVSFARVVSSLGSIPIKRGDIVSLK